MNKKYLIVNTGSNPNPTVQVLDVDQNSPTYNTVIASVSSGFSL